MYDKSLIIERLQNIETSLETIILWTNRIYSVNDFLTSNEGMILLNAVCMKLFAVGEEVKSIDKHTDKKLLLQYPNIQWKYVMGMRDVIAHHYFEIDTDKIFDTLQNDIPSLLKTIIQIKKNLGQKC